MKKQLGITMVLSLCLLTSTAALANDAVVGAIIGSTTGVLVGRSVGGRDGAVVGAALGAAAGAAIGSDYDAYLKTHQAINFGIKNILESSKIKLAYPTQSVSLLK